MCKVRKIFSFKTLSEKRKVLGYAAPRAFLYGYKKEISNVFFGRLFFPGRAEPAVSSFGFVELVGKHEIRRQVRG